MSERWLLANRAFFVRDLVRDYCMVFRLLSDQRRRFERDGTVSYSALRDLLGEAMRKGVFWRLKDTAHHLFRNATRPASATVEGQGIVLWQYAASPHPDGMAVQSPVEALIDWCVGYAFHECAKLKEDAFQGQHYANRLAQLGQTVGVMLPLEGVFLELGAFVKSVTNAPVDEGLHRALHGHAVGMRAGRVLPEHDALAFHRCGSRAGRIAEQVMGRVLEPPEHALAHGLAQQVAQGRVGYRAVALKAPPLIGQQPEDHAVVAHQVAHKKGSVGQQPAFAHASSSRSRALATARS